MADIRLQKLAKLIVSYCVETKKDDWTYISGDYVAAKDLMHELYREVIRAGGHPFIVPSGNELMEIYYKESSIEQLQWISPTLRTYMDKLDAMISLYGTSNTAALNNVDPSKQQARAKVMGEEIYPQYFQRKAEGKLKATVSLFPCPALAQDAEMSLSEYEDFVYGAMFCDREDPIAEWKKLHEKQQVLIDWLKGKENVEIRGENVDLKFSIKDRVFINSSGKANMPSGEIFTGPVEDSVEGKVAFTYPAIERGRVVDNVQLTFEKGKVIEAHADKNKEFLHKMIATDNGSCYLGEFGIGTNFGIQKFTKQILFDEKIGGTFHLALGMGYPETGSVNKSGIHWDLICDPGKDGEIVVDEEPLFKNGNFVLWDGK